MGVYINMEMPTSCRECWLKMNCDDCEGWECVCVPLHQQIGYLGDLLTDKRRDDCPLVPVPPHGRSIDADVLLEWANADLRFGDPDFHAGLWHAVSAIKAAPTIIPAEPPKEET